MARTKIKRKSQSQKRRKRERREKGKKIRVEKTGPTPKAPQNQEPPKITDGLFGKVKLE